MTSLWTWTIVRPLAIPVICVALATFGACSRGGGGGGGGGGSGMPPSPAVNLTGTWSGTLNDSQGPATLTWQLQQSSAALSGTLSVSGTVAGITRTRGGTIAGTVLSTTAINFAMNIGPGGGCPAFVAGDAAIANASIQGTYTGSDCTGPITNGQFSLAKQ